MLVVSAQLIDDFMGESIQSKLCIVFLHQNFSMQLTATATATAGFKMFLNHEQKEIVIIKSTSLDLSGGRALISSLHHQCHSPQAMILFFF